MTAPLTDEQLTQIEARATSEHLTPGPWRPDYEQCDCSDGYCHHGAYVTGVFAPTPTEIALDRCKRTGEAPRDYDFHRSEIGDFTEADWELMTHAREDVSVLVDEVKRLRAELAREQENYQAYRIGAEGAKQIAVRHIADLDRMLSDTIDDRDQAQEIADKLAYAVAPIEVIGEHSSMNDPWTNALDLITPKAEVDKLRAQLAAATDLPDEHKPREDAA